MLWWILIVYVVVLIAVGLFIARCLHYFPGEVQKSTENIKECWEEILKIYKRR